MSDDNLIVTKDARGVLELKLNRPEKHNAFDDHLLAKLLSVLQAYREDSTVRLLLLTATGTSFSAGADLNWMKRMKDYSMEQNYQDSKVLANMLEALSNFPIPTMAVVQGAAFGGGIGLIACCDIAIASTNAVFAFSEVSLGLIPAVISPYVIRSIGARTAQHLFLTGERFGASDAKHYGLLHHIFTEETLEEKRNAYVETLLKNGPMALRELKSIMHLNQKTNDIDIHDLMVERIATIRVSPEAQEGLAAFLNKRQPKWETCSNES